MQASLETVLAFIARADLTELDQITTAVGERRDPALQEWRADLKGGETAILIGIHPAHYKGLTGVVVGKAPRSSTAYIVRLDERSTQLLRLNGKPQTLIPLGVTEHEITVPVANLGPCRPADQMPDQSPARPIAPASAEGGRPARA